jgi:hypothetical protein
VSDNICTKKLKNRNILKRLLLISNNKYFLVSARQVPFRLSFFTDGDEQNAIAAINTFANELAVAPTGSIGFSLRYTQSICP